MGKFSFHKGERLSKEKSIQELFKRGSSFNLYPFRILYLPNPQESPSHQVLFTASAKTFKSAVDRNKIKRRSREAYRLQKGRLNETPKLLIGFIYIGKEIEQYDHIQRAVARAIGKLNDLNAEPTAN